MIKIVLPIISSICLIIFCTGLTGCYNNFDKFYASENQQKDSKDTIDYNQYLKKIWVVKNWDGGKYDASSFFISKLENGIIEGKFSTCSVAEPDFYYYSIDSSKYLGNLSGTVYNGVAKCQFSDKNGNKGNVIFTFIEKAEIEATIEYADKGEVYKDRLLDGKLIFRPYNLKDVKYFTQFDGKSFSVDINSWGNVNFVAGEDINSLIRPVGAFLLDDEGNILYNFSNAFPNNVPIKTISFQDINNDNLKDMIIMLGDEEDSAGELTKVLFQNNDGTFYNDHELNTEIYYLDNIREVKDLLDYLSKKY